MSSKEEILSKLITLDEMLRKINNTHSIDMVEFNEIVGMWKEVSQYMLSFHNNEAIAALIQEMNTRHLKNLGSLTQKSQRILQIIGEVYHIANR